MCYHINEVRILEKIRLNVTLTLEMKRYIEEMSFKLGISQNAFISLMLSEYKKNNPSL